MTNEKREPKPSTSRVFVYGSLKRGRGNHGLLAGSKFLGRTVINGDYRMLDLTYFPGCVRTRGLADHPHRDILGEVYEVDEETLHSLDVLEGHPNYFKRSKIVTEFKNAWMYFFPQDQVDKYRPVDDGIWQPTEEEYDFVAKRNAG